jgi:hypothetical protein
MLLLNAKNHTIVFKTMYEFNKNRGAEIWIIPIYSKIVKDDLINLNTEMSIDKIKKILENNINMLSVIKIDINPVKKLQAVNVFFEDNILCCMVLFINNQSANVNKTLLLDKDSIKNEIYILCDKNGIKISS